VTALTAEQSANLVWDAATFALKAKSSIKDGYNLAICYACEKAGEALG